MKAKSTIIKSLFSTKAHLWKEPFKSRKIPLLGWVWQDAGFDIFWGYIRDANQK